MVATSKIQAERVAQAGARKMEAQGYTFTRSAANPGVFRIIKPEGGFYFVQDGPNMEPHCMCPFFADNSAFGTCKHIAWLRAELAWQADAERRAAEWEAEQQARGELAAF